jgi:hypothetical protein
MLVTLSGISTLVISVFSANAFLPMLVTNSPSMVRGIRTFFSSPVKVDILTPPPGEPDASRSKFVCSRTGGGDGSRLHDAVNNNSITARMAAAARDPRFRLNIIICFFLLESFIY